MPPEKRRIKAGIELGPLKTNGPAQTGTTESATATRAKLIADTAIYAFAAFVFATVWFKLLTLTVDLETPLLRYSLARLLMILLVILFTRYAKALLIGLGSSIVLVSLSGVLFPARIGSPIIEWLKYQAIELKDSLFWAFNLDPQLEMPKLFLLYLSLLATFVAVVMIWLKPMPLLLTIVFVVPFFLLYQTNPDAISLPLIFAGLLCLAVTFSRQSNLGIQWRSSWQFPPISLIAAILALVFVFQLVLPQDFFKNTWVSRWLDQMIKSRQHMPDTVQYFEFSLRDAGYYPEDRRLGGPVELKHQPFMTVEGPGESFYLRGTVYNQFSGNIWEASPMEPNYLFYNTDPIKEQRASFGYHDAPNIIADYQTAHFRPALIRIKPLYQPIQVVFHGGIPVRISLTSEQSEKPILPGQTVPQPEAADKSEETMFYFNPHGQIYASKTLADPGYEVGGYVSLLGSANYSTERLIPPAQEGKIHFSKQTQSNLKSYREFLQANQPDLAKIVYAEATEPLQQAQKINAIADYLNRNFTYQLDVEAPREGEDFFEFFIREKRGYCTSFATAMTVLAREAGFEARYVEGFMVKGVTSADLKNESYSRMVSSDEAHAWSEIRVDEIGFVPFDPTPAATLNEMRTDQEQETRLREQQQQQTTETQTQPTPPTTEPPPQTNPPPPTETPMTQPPLPSDASQPDPSLTLTQIWQKTKFFILAIVLIALILALIYWRHRVYHRRHSAPWLLKASGHRPETMVLMIWQDLKYLYRLNGEEISPDQTPLRTCANLSKRFTLPPDQTFNACRAIEQVLYSQHPPLDSDVQSLLVIYDEVEQYTKNNLSKSKWLFRRYLFSPRSFDV